MNEYARSYCGGQPPESALEIDVAITHPAAVTLEELEALSALEPYGSGNARPVFCLLGATLLRTQNVGQNRHLKLRLGKGCAQFDGIFFSTVAERCGCHRATGWTRPFICRSTSSGAAGRCSCRWWISDPPLCASGREQEALTLAHPVAAGGAVPLRDARRALPTGSNLPPRGGFGARRAGGGADRRHPAPAAADGLGAGRRGTVPAGGRVRRRVPGTGIAGLAVNGDAITLHLHRGNRVSLEQSPLMAALAKRQ